MGFLIFLGILLYILIKTWKQVIKLILIGIVLIFAFTVVKLKEGYDYLTTPINTEKTVNHQSSVDTGIVSK